MSADLFAAFAAPGSELQQQQQQQQPQDQQNQRQQQQQQHSQGRAAKPQASSATLIETEHRPTLNFFDDWKAPSDEKDSSSNVLFDATTETLLEDDWGDFESAEPVAAYLTPEAKPHEKNVDLLSDSLAAESFQFAIPEKSKPQTKVSSPQNARRPSSSSHAHSRRQKAPTSAPVSAPIDLLSSVELQSTKSDVSNISHADADTDVESWADSWVAVDEDANGQTPAVMEESWADDDWGEFTTVPPSSSFKPSQRTSNPSRHFTTRSSQQLPTKTSRPTERPVDSTLHQQPRPAPASVPMPSVSGSQVRPTNIPPPAILLALFPSLLDETRNQCLDAKGDPTLLTYLSQTVPPLLRTMTRILLGRSVRWKRDSILSQSTRIGPAGSGRGMKLNSVNKNESAKEEREAVEVLARWRSVGGVLNSTVSTAKGGQTVQVPAEPNYVAHVRTVGTAEGAVRAQHACALCGLKRHERVVKIDDQAFDNFGEWWIDHWGHRDCQWFWETYECRLEHR
ncbi:hypothetical protein KEM56_005968 [Ascosphaera pollenicola]|nr:hypothetical protein KEM56_005968 [Ascosphaera pollenicola]